MEGYDDNDIVISGISGMFPMSQNPDEFLENLMNNVDMTSADHDKWTDDNLVPKKLGCIKDLDKCDAQYFGIMRKQVNSLDLVTRQFLERSVESVFDAGVNPIEIRGSNTGVYISVALLDTEMLLMSSNVIEKYGIMGRSRALNANRISYIMDLKGPSYATDAFFNGGVQCLQEAYYAMKTGKVDSAIVGSGMTILHPQSSDQFNQLHVLSPDGNTRTFDAHANGYARAEAISVMFLQRAKDARRVHAQVMHVLTQSMCSIPSLMHEPLQDNWYRLFKQFYEECQVDPKNVTYLEADGMSLPNFDAAEMNAAGEFFCKDRSESNPLLIGSVKSNMGHAEGASAMCSLAKLAITLAQETIPANLHYNNPNPLIRDLLRGNMKVVTENTKLEGELVAMNAFGFGQNYGHILLKKTPKTKQHFEPDPEAMPHLILATSRQEDGVNTVLDKVESMPYDPEYYGLVNCAFSRILPGHVYRGFTIVPKNEDVIIRDSGLYQEAKRPIWFVFSGMGSQWPTFGRQLLAIPTFKKSMEKSANVLKPLGIDIMQLITLDDKTLFDNIIHCFVSIVATQIAFVDVLRELGVEPDGIIGHSVGETSASYADGCLTHEQTILSAYYRGRASNETQVIKGTMAAVGIGYNQMKSRLPAGIEVACHNGPDSCTLSGPAEQVEEFVKQLTAEGIFARAVNVANIPYHTKYIKDMGPKMLEYIKQVIPEGKKRSPRWVSSSYPESEWSNPNAKICDAEYHIHNLLSPVLFEEASRHIPDNAITIELAPHGLLQAILKRSLPKCTNLGLTNRSAKNQQHVFLRALGSLFLNGVSTEMKHLYPAVIYPVSRGTPFVGNLLTWDHTDNWATFRGAYVKENSNSVIYNLPLDTEDTPIKAYNQAGTQFVPYGFYLVKVWETYAATKNKILEEFPVTFTDVIYHQNPNIDSARAFKLEVLIQPGTGNFEVLTAGLEKNELLVTGNITATEDSSVPTIELEDLTARTMHAEEFYQELQHHGHEYNDILKPVSTAAIGDRIWKARVSYNSDLSILIESLLQMGTLKASTSSANVSKIKKIRKVVCDMKDLSSDEVVLEVATNTLVSKNVVIQDVDFATETRKPVKFFKEELNKPLVTLPPASDSLVFEYLQYDGVEIEGKQVAYLAKQGGNRIIGLGHSENISAVVRPDDILKWRLPANWDAHQSMPIPLNYSMAYYAIHVAAQADANRSIAITDGFSKLGLACARVALDLTSDVFVVVNSEQDKQYMKYTLPKLADDRILINKSGSSEQLCLQLRKRSPKGLDIIINTGAPDIPLLAVQCLKPFGCIVELSNKLFNTRGKLTNSYDYLISASLISCAGHDLCDNYVEIKKQVQQLFEQGIANGVVVPYSHAQLRDWNDIKTVKIANENRRFECDADKAYLIIGGDSYSWLSLVEWFVNRKATNIIVVPKTDQLNVSLKNKLNQLQEKCKIVVKAAEAITPKLIDHIFEVVRTKIALTFIAPLDKDGQLDKDVLQAIQNKDTFLVTMLSPTSNLAESFQRRNNNLTVLWNQSLIGRTQCFLKTLDRLLILEKGNVVHIDDEKQEATGNADPYDQILPKSLEEVVRYGQFIRDDITVTEIKTKNMGMRHTKEIPPIFVVPGLNRSEILDRMGEFMNPVFVVDFPLMPALTVQEYASFLIPKMVGIAPGPYVMVGDGWGGAVALETARILERSGEETQLFLISSTPEDIFNKFNSPAQLDVTLLSRIFNVQPEELCVGSSWRERMNLCIASLGSEEIASVARGLTAVRERAVSLIDHRDSSPISGSVHCISRQNCVRSSVSWMSEKEVLLTVVEANESLVNDAVLNMMQQSVTSRSIKRQ